MNFLKILSPSLKVINGYEDLQKRINEKSEFLEKTFYSFNELNKYLKEVFKKLLIINSNFTNIPFSLEEQNIQETCKLIYQKIINNVEQHNQLVENILKNFTEHLKTFNNEKILYNEFKKIIKELEDEMEKLQKNKEIYHKIGKDSENKIIKFVENNLQKLSNLPLELKRELDSINFPFIKALNTYKNSVDKVNQLKKKYNNTLNIMNDYLPELGNEDGVFFFRIVKLYLENLEDGEKYLNLNKNQLNESKTVETNSKLKELIENNDKNKQDEKPIDLIQYQTGLDFNKCKNKEEFDLYAKSVEMINKNINSNIFPNYNYDNDFKNFEEGKLIKELFEEKDIDERKAQKFLNSLKDESLHKNIYIVISQLRTKGKFQKSKPLIELLGKTFQILLDFAEKSKIYENAKNIIILSQTYFYYDENKNKIHVFDLIKNNKWLTNSQFWRGFIDYMIKKEFERMEKILPESNFNMEEDININQKVRDEINEVIFSQLLPFINNMIDFGIDKRIILKIADEFKEKFNLSPTNLEVLYGIISSNKEEIEKLRKDYNTSLESELISGNGDNSKNKINENINKENIKRNKEEEKGESEFREELKEKSKIKEDIKQKTLDNEESKDINNDKEELKI